MKMIRKIILISAFTALLPSFGFTQGDLLISPLRVVFEGNKQKEELNLVNIGEDTAEYSISFIQYKMNEDGNFDVIEKPIPGQMFANTYLRIFPRTVKLAPKEAQVVRLQYRKGKDMVDGEYRSHIYFRSELENQPIGVQPSKPEDSTKMGVQITPIFGISIPVIIREGNVSVQSSISDIQVEDMPGDTTVNLKLTLNREGNISTYGDIVVDYIPTSGKAITVGLVRGLSVYTTISKRFFSLKLALLPGVDINKGKLKVMYTSPKDSPYKIFAEKEFILGR